jgi:GxxExxY protein
LDHDALISDRIIAAAIEVHRHLGPGLLESAYEAALAIEFDQVGMRFGRQLVYPVIYKGRPVAEHRVDLLVEDTVVVEVKSVAHHEPVFDAQVLTYLRITGKRVGLLLNFHARVLKDGIKRYVL